VLSLLETYITNVSGLIFVSNTIGSPFASVHVIFTESGST
jgi:hypothetical protein